MGRTDPDRYEPKIAARSQARYIANTARLRLTECDIPVISYAGNDMNSYTNMPAKRVRPRASKHAIYKGRENEVEVRKAD
jgi:hypothetical protein